MFIVFFLLNSEFEGLLLFFINFVDFFVYSAMISRFLIDIERSFKNLECILKY